MSSVDYILKRIDKWNCFVALVCDGETEIEDLSNEEIRYGFIRDVMNNLRDTDEEKLNDLFKRILFYAYVDLTLNGTLEYFKNEVVLFETCIPKEYVIEIRGGVEHIVGHDVYDKVLKILGNEYEKKRL